MKNGVDDKLESVQKKKVSVSSLIYGRNLSSSHATFDATSVYPSTILNVF